MRHYVVAAAAAFALMLPAAGRTQAPVTPSAQNPVREITKIAGEVYRFRNNFHYSVFAVTPAGIIATDPINADAATWLKEEMQKRLPNQPITLRGLQPRPCRPHLGRRGVRRHRHRRGARERQGGDRRREAADRRAAA